jgi:YegS/Rv2252/BmrU family lipid kinase
MTDCAVRACLITNPRSGRGGIDLSSVLPVLAAHNWQVTVRQKLHGGEATKLAREAAADGYDIVVACGGDGTVRQIVDGLVGTDVAVGVLPGGTVNLWARELGVSTDLEQAALQLIDAQRRRVDVGRVTINGRRGRHFLLMAGLGFDGAVIARVSKPLKNRIGTLAVGLAALEALPSFKPVEVRVDFDGTHWEGRLSQIVVANTRRYGGFTSFTPDAYVDDGLLDVCLIAAAGTLRGGRQLASLVLRGRPNPASAELHRVASLTVTAQVPMPMQLDGGAVRLKKKDQRPGKEITYGFAVVAQGLNMLVPREYNGELFTHGALHNAERARPGALQGRPHRGQHDRHEEPGKRIMRITAVGPDTFTAMRLRDEKMVTVLLDSVAELRDAHGNTLPGHDVLPALAPGRIVDVKGKKDRDRGIIQAKRITLLSPD